MKGGEGRKMYSTVKTILKKEKKKHSTEVSREVKVFSASEFASSAR